MVNFNILVFYRMFRSHFFHCVSKSASLMSMNNSAAQKCHLLYSKAWLAVGKHLLLASLMRVLPQEPGRIEYYYQLFCLCGHLGGGGERCLRFKPPWMFQIYKYVIKGHEELTSCSSVMHSYLFPLLDVLSNYINKLGISHFGQ